MSADHVSGYLKYLYPYECAMHNFSTPKELQTAIDNNRRDRFSSLYPSQPSMSLSSREDNYPGSYVTSASSFRPLSPPRVSSLIRSGLHTYPVKRPHAVVGDHHLERHDSPKVIILQNGSPVSTQEYVAARSGSLLHRSSQSPFRTYASKEEKHSDSEIVQRAKHVLLARREWNGNSVHVIDDDGGSRAIGLQRSQILVNGDKSFEGHPVFHGQSMQEERGIKEPIPSALCPCKYCTVEYKRPYFSPPRDQYIRKSPADSGNSSLDDPKDIGKHSPPKGLEELSPSESDSRSTEKSAEQSSIPSLPKMSLKFGDSVKSSKKSIQLTLEIDGTIYAGTLEARGEKVGIDNNDLEQQANS